MFNKKITVEEYKKGEIDRVDEGIRLYRRECELQVEIDIANKRNSMMREVEELAIQCAKQTGEYEHDFHSNKEDLRSELAKIEAIIDSKKLTLAKHDTLLKDLETTRAERDQFKGESNAKDLVIKKQDETIKLLDDTVKVVVGKLSTIDIKSLGLNVTANVAKDK